MRTRMEKSLILVRREMLITTGIGKSQQSIPQRRAQFPGIVRREVFED